MCVTQSVKRTPCLKTQFPILHHGKVKVRKMKTNGRPEIIEALHLKTLSPSKDCGIWQGDKWKKRTVQTTGASFTELHWKHPFPGIKQVLYCYSKRFRFSGTVYDYYFESSPCVHNSLPLKVNMDPTVILTINSVPSSNLSLHPLFFSLFLNEVMAALCVIEAGGSHYKSNT